MVASTITDRTSGIGDGEDAAVTSGKTAVKEAVIVATTANITLSGTQTIDGVAVVAGDRVLVKDQTDATQNGIYVVSADAWTRALDADANGELAYGTQILVMEGSTHAFATFYVSTEADYVVDTTEVAFTKFSVGAGDVVGPASSTDDSIVRMDGTSGKSITGSTVTIDNSGVVAGASIDFGSNTISTTLAQLNAAISDGSVLSGSVTNADVDAAAAIDATKIHDGSISNTEFGYLNGVTSGIQAQLDAKAASSHTHAASDITSGTLAHEQGGLEADVSGYSGLLKISGGATSQITDNSANWNTAYGWGDHASAGYLTSYTETDPVVGAVTGIVKADGAGNISAAVAGTDYLASETYTGTVTSVGMSVPTGLVVSGSPVTTSGTLAVAFDTGYSIPTTANQTNWTTAYNWGDHSSAGYLTSYTETDPVVGAISGIVKANGAGAISAAVAGTDYAAASHSHSTADITDLSSWAGSTSLTTLGTISSGAWQGTAVADAYISSAATWNAKIANIVEDTTPELGGDLDLAGYDILDNGAASTVFSKVGSGSLSVTAAGGGLNLQTTSGNSNVTISAHGTGNIVLGNYILDGDQTVGVGQDGYVLTYDNGTGLVSLEASAGGGISASDSPVWTGSHDFGGATVELPNGTAPTTSTTGQVAIDTNGVSPVTRGVMQYFDGTSNLYLWGTSNAPSSDNDVMVYDAGSNSIVWEAQSGGGGGSGITDVVQDTTPQLGGMLDVNGFALGDGTRELLTFTEDASAVNQVNIENQATGSGPIISAAGDDTNIDLVLSGKGTGNVVVGGNRVLTTGDEGSGNGLDADTLDGNQASAFALVSHTHAISDVTGLQTALDGKQPLDGDLTAIAAIAGTSGLLKKTAANTWTLDTSAYLTSYTETDPVVGAISGIVKADGAGNISAAVAGTDYLATETYTGTVTSVGLTAGTGISVSGGPVTSSGSITVTNTAPDQTVVLTQGSNVTITGTYPNFTIAATDTNTTYTAGTGLDLTGTAFSVAAPTMRTDTAQTMTAQLTVKEVAETTATTTTTASFTADPTDGTMHVNTYAGGVTINAANFSNGQSVTILCTAATTATAGASVNWVTSDGAAPTISGSNNVFVLWKQNNVQFLSYVGTDG